MNNQDITAKIDDIITTPHANFMEAFSDSYDMFLMAIKETDEMMNSCDGEDHEDLTHQLRQSLKYLNIHIMSMRHAHMEIHDKLCSWKHHLTYHAAPPYEAPAAADQVVPE